MTTLLILVQHEDDDGNNLDLVVEASTGLQGADIWRLYYQLPDYYIPDTMIVLPERTREARAIPWAALPCTRPPPRYSCPSHPQAPGDNHHRRRSPLHSKSLTEIPMLNIILEGGLVQAIESNDPALIGLEVNTIDLDSEGADDDETDTVLVDGKEERAVIGITNVRPITIRKVEG